MERRRGGKGRCVGVGINNKPGQKERSGGGEDVPIGVSVIGPVRWGSGDLTLAGTARTTL
jgi:hypothetical protein